MEVAEVDIDRFAHASGILLVAVEHNLPAGSGMCAAVGLLAKW